MVVRLSTNDLQIRRVNFLPGDLQIKPEFPADIRFKPEAQLTLTQLFGQGNGNAHYIGAYLWNALKVATYGSGFQRYGIKAGTAPAAFSSSHELNGSGVLYHRFDILVETQEAVIRFYQDIDALYGDEIPLPVGVHSLEFCSSICQIKYRTSAGTYQITGYR